MPDEGPPSAGVPHINEYGRNNFEGCLECRWTENAGRVLHARRGWKQGDVILVESPLHVVQQQHDWAAYRRLVQLCKEHSAHFDYEPLWYWCALQSLTGAQLEGAKEGGWKGTDAETQRNLLLLHHEEVTSPSNSSLILARELAPGANAITIERLTQIWVLNCFEYSDDPEGYSTYFFSSFMSHSCYPNAVWHYTGADHVLRARRDIHPGDEVCISYLAEHVLLQSAPVRRMELHRSKRFWCACERCAGEQDLSRGLFCSQCGNGHIFARTPNGGPARDAALLVEHFEGSSCRSCGHTVSGAEAKRLADNEKRLQAMVEDFTYRTEHPKARAPFSSEQMKQSEEFIDSNFAQHILADLAWEQLVALYKGGADRRRLLRRRCDFYRETYPGLNGAHAWALEALADALAPPSGLLTTKAAPLAPGPVPPRPPDNAADEALDKEAAAKMYDEALDILRPMFGEEHEYVTEVARKLSDLRAAKGAAAA